MKITTYSIIEATSVSNMVTAVNEALEKGWQPFGTLVEGTHSWVQPLVKYEPESAVKWDLYSNDVQFIGVDNDGSAFAYIERPLYNVITSQFDPVPTERAAYNADMTGLLQPNALYLRSGEIINFGGRS